MNFLEKLKNAYKSSTIWFNAVAAVAIPIIDLIQDPFVSSFVPAPWVLAVTVIGNVLLRFKTKLPLEQK